MFTGSFSALASSLHTLTPGQLFNVREMGLLGWLLVDLGINWAGWAVAAALKVRRGIGLMPYRTGAVPYGMPPKGGQRPRVTGAGTPRVRKARYHTPIH